MHLQSSQDDVKRLKKSLAFERSRRQELENEVGPYRSPRSPPVIEAGASSRKQALIKPQAQKVLHGMQKFGSRSDAPVGESSPIGATPPGVQTRYDLVNERITYLLKT